jgi:hypothetical protein
MSIYLHPFAATIWALGIVSMYGLAWIALFRPGQRRHDLFAAYCTYSAVASSILFVCSALQEGWAYFYVSGCVSPTQDALGTAVVVQYVWRSCSNYLKQAKALSHTALNVFPFLVCAVSIVLRFPPKVNEQWNSAEWAIVLLCGGFLWVISFASDSWKVLWRTREYGVAVGFLFLFAHRVLLVGLRQVIPVASRPLLFGPEVCLSLAVTFIWLRFFLKKEPELLVPTLQQLTAVHVMIHSFAKSEVLTARLVSNKRRRGTHD